MRTIKENLKMQLEAAMKEKKVINANSIAPARWMDDKSNYSRKTLLSLANEMGYKVNRYSYCPHDTDFYLHGNTTVIYSKE
jgi:hypothetical protein